MKVNLPKMTELQTLLRFEPYFKSVIWGGDRIAKLKSLCLPDHRIGESWEISALPGFESRVASGSFKGLTICELVKRFKANLVGDDVYSRWGDTFPLLIKFIDAQSNLSIQVHPDDVIALKHHGTLGKTEMWYIVDAAPDSMIYAGLKESMTSDLFLSKAIDGSIMDSVTGFNASKGQFYFIPAGTVHAIGAGTFVAEIQETSDVSYRIYDYDRIDSNGKKRTLHIDEACKALDMSSLSKEPIDLQNVTDASVIKSEFFSVDYINPLKNGNDLIRMTGVPGSFSVIMAVHGDIECVIGSKSFPLPIGNTGLIPADVSAYSVRSKFPFLLISLPKINSTLA